MRPASRLEDEIARLRAEVARRPPVENHSNSHSPLPDGRGHRDLEGHPAAAANDDGRAADCPEQFGGGIIDIVVPSSPGRRQIVRRPPIRPYVQALEVGHRHSPGA